MTTMVNPQLAARLARLVGEQPGWAQLNERLLAAGGRQVACRYEEDLDLLLAEGEILTLPVLGKRGAPCACHANAAGLYESDPARYAIGTGWALSDDGLWRQHSWARRDERTLIETTEPRVAYFGVWLTGAHADRFAAENL